MLPRFDAGQVWQLLQRTRDPVSVLMGVPTMYAKLLDSWDGMAPQQQRDAAAAAGRVSLDGEGVVCCAVVLLQQLLESGFRRAN